MQLATMMMGLFCFMFCMSSEMLSLNVLLLYDCLFPDAAPEVLFKEHAEHLAFEFRTAIRRAYEDGTYLRS